MEHALMEAELVPLLALFQDIHLVLARGAFPIGVLLVSDKVLKGERLFHNTEIWCFSRDERMIDEYIIEFDDYIGIGAGSVSIVRQFLRQLLFTRPLSRV